MPEIEKELFSWQAPARPFRHRSREYYITLIAIASIISLILFLAEGVMPVVLLVSLLFLFYVLNTIEPETITYQITTWGIKVGGARTQWVFLGRFWFSQKGEVPVLVLETRQLPGRIELVINQTDQEKIKTELKKYLPEEEARVSTIDKTLNWVSQKLPGNQ